MDTISRFLVWQVMQKHFKCNLSNIYAAFYTISTDSVLARFLCISRASCFETQCMYNVVVIELINHSISQELGMHGITQ